MISNDVRNTVDSGLTAPDYYGEDGLMHCGVCHEPKEKRYPSNIQLFGNYRHPSPCACERARQRKEEADRENREHQQRVDRLRGECFLYPVLRKWTFDSLSIQNQQTALCRQYVKQWERAVQTGEGLLLWGKVGTGKTCLAACVANSLLEQEVAVRMVTLSAVMNYGFDGRQEYMQRLCSCPLLILDDLGSERDTKFGLETVFELIDGRLLNRKPLIVTTNLTLEEMKHPKNTDLERIYDRLLSVTVPIRFAGENLRKRQHEEQQTFMKILRGEES